MRSSPRQHARNLPDSFVDRFAVVGRSDVVEKRLRELAGTGVDRVVLVWGSRDADMQVVEKSIGALSAEVLPGLRAQTP